MGKRSNPNAPTLQIDHYRKQLGKQENKIVKSRVKEIKQKKADKNTVDKFNSHLVALAVVLVILFVGYLFVNIYNKF